MRKHVEESGATGAAAGRGRGDRFSAGRKREVVLRLLRGEDLESVSRAVGITAARASHWRAQFLAAGQRRATRPRTRAIPRSTSTWSGGAMTPISRRPIPRRCCIGRAKARKPSWRISATCCWTIDRGLSPTSARPTRRGPPNATRRCCCWRPAPPRAARVGADKGYDVARFVADVRVQDVTPHVAQKVRGSAIDGRTTRHAGYHVSQRKQKLVEQVFGWMKTVGGLRKLRHRGIALVDWQLTFAATAYNLVRLRNLEARCP